MLTGMLRIVMAASRQTGHLLAVLLTWFARVLVVDVEAMNAVRQSRKIEILPVGYHIPASTSLRILSSVNSRKAGVADQFRCVARPERGGHVYLIMASGRSIRTRGQSPAPWR